MLRKPTTPNGFTLVELIVVVAIIGILATLGTSSYAGVMERSREARALSDLNDIKKAILQLGIDTYRQPSGLALTTCTANPESFLNSPSAGLVSTDGNFPNWNGPYIDASDTLDQWGRPYYFDPDYRCRSYVAGCEDIENDKTVKVIQTFGPNGVQGYGDGDTRDKDNVVLVLCDP